MTVDFRQPGPRETGGVAAGGSAAERNRRIVIRAILANAAFAFIAGVALMAVEQPYFSRDLVVVLGPLLILIALFDLMAARFLRWAWARQRN